MYRILFSRLSRTPRKHRGSENYALITRSNSNLTVLGIETSCDDTGCAIVNSSKNLLGESLYSQSTVHLRFGGVNPVNARELHRENIEAAVKEALENAQLAMKDVDAIAVTTRPGLLLSLQIGVMYANYLARKCKKPLIPIHHMEAHALMARMCHEIPFPFLVLLISGGDCILAIAKDVNEFLLLGKTLDNAPGEVLDKVARRLKLKNIPEFSKLPGGRAIEVAAKKSTNPRRFAFTTPLMKNRDCNFSFSGVKDAAVRILLREEEKHSIVADGIIPGVFDLCAAFQLTVAEHIVQRVERAILFCEKNNYLGDKRNLVVSGGVACNNFIFDCLQYVGNKLDYKVYRPPPKLCTDNGVMIAWNGIEKAQKQCEYSSHINLKDIDPNAGFGRSIVDRVILSNLQTKVTRLNKLYIGYSIVNSYK